MYKKSFYLVEQEIPETGQMLVFSTRTAKWSYFSKEEYEEIFEKGHGEASPRLQELLDADILIDAERDELAELQEKRDRMRKQYNALPVTNYVITPTMDCNARCFYCYEHTACHDIHYDKMTPKMAEHVAHFILKSSKGTSFTIHWYGGEPLMEAHIIDRISEILNENNAKYVANITTNAYLMTPEIVEKMKSKWHIHMVKVTVDDIGDRYNKIKNYKEPCVENPFEYVMGNVKYAVDAGVKVRLRTNYNPLETEVIEKMYTYMHEFFEHNPNIHFHFTPIDANSDKIPALSDDFSKEKEHPYLKALKYEEKCDVHENESLYNKEEQEIAKKFTPWCNIRSRLSTDPVSRILCDHYLQPVPFNCLGVCDNSIAIDSYGDIYVCHKLLGQGKELSSGNVIDGIIRNDVYHHFQDTHPEPECVNCVLLPLCGGGCKYRRINYKSNHHLPIKGTEKAIVLRAVRKIEEYQGVHNDGTGK